jgi:hypothetical protein
MRCPLCAKSGLSIREQRCLALSAQWSETRANLFYKELRLFPSCNRDAFSETTHYLNRTLRIRLLVSRWDEDRNNGKDA